jgi:hypothetical protein
MFEIWHGGCQIPTSKSNFSWITLRGENNRILRWRIVTDYIFDSLSDYQFPKRTVPWRLGLSCWWLVHRSRNDAVKTAEFIRRLIILNIMYDKINCIRKKTVVLFFHMPNWHSREINTEINHKMQSREAFFVVETRTAYLTVRIVRATITVPTVLRHVFWYILHNNPQQ